MIKQKDLIKIKNELLKLFPDVENIDTQVETTRGNSRDKFYYQTFCLYLSKGKRVILKFSKDYLEQNSFSDFKQHLQRNIYYVTKSNINKSIYLLKNFEIEVDELNYA